MTNAPKAKFFKRSEQMTTGAMLTLAVGARDS